MARPRGREMEKPDVQDTVGLYLKFSQKPFVDFEHIGVLPCGEHGGHQL